jgi:ATP-dependent Lhr-like helicase
MPRWRDLLGIFRRMEARGEVRGGRFLSGFGGEQFALPEAVESLREMRRRDASTSEVTVAAADPLNLVGIVVPGERVAAIPGRTVTFVNGTAVGAVALVPSGAEEIPPDQDPRGELLPLAAPLLRELPMEGARV